MGAHPKEGWVFILKKDGCPSQRRMGVHPKEGWVPTPKKDGCRPQRRMGTKVGYFGMTTSKALRDVLA